MQCCVSDLMSFGNMQYGSILYDMLIHTKTNVSSVKFFLNTFVNNSMEIVLVQNLW